jgi:hypothetical protein
MHYRCTCFLNNVVAGVYSSCLVILLRDFIQVNSGAAVTHALRKALHDRHTVCKRSVSVGVAWTAIEVLRETLPDTTDISKATDHAILQQDWYDPSNSNTNSNSDSNGNDNSIVIDKTEKAEHARYNELHSTAAAAATETLHTQRTRYITLHCYTYK